MNKIEALSTITKIDPEQGLVEVEVISNFKGITHKMQVRWEDQTHQAVRMGILGHESPAVNQGYLHADCDAKKAVLDKMPTLTDLGMGA